MMWRVNYWSRCDVLRARFRGVEPHQIADAVVSARVQRELSAAGRLERQRRQLS